MKNKLANLTICIKSFMDIFYKPFEEILTIQDFIIEYEKENKSIHIKIFGILLPIFLVELYLFSLENNIFFSIIFSSKYIIKVVCNYFKSFEND